MQSSRTLWAICAKALSVREDGGSEQSLLRICAKLRTLCAIFTDALSNLQRLLGKGSKQRFIGFSEKRLWAIFTEVLSKFGKGSEQYFCRLWAIFEKALSNLREGSEQSSRRIWAIFVEALSNLRKALVLANVLSNLRGGSRQSSRKLCAILLMFYAIFSDALSNLRVGPEQFSRRLCAILRAPCAISTDALSSLAKALRESSE